MRELKFIAWDTFNNCFLKKYGKIDEHVSPWIGNRSPQYKVMQYIGRKDKDGIDIYEGYILKDNYGRILLVECYKYCFSFKAITETNFLRARDISQWFEGEETFPEIIGHIYENPKLVKETNSEK